MASSHAHHAQPHRYPPHTTNPPPHVSPNDFRLPPLRSLNFAYRSPHGQQQDAESAYAGFDVPQDVNSSPPSHSATAPSAPAANGTSFSAFGYATPTPTSAPAYVQRQPFAFQAPASGQSQQQQQHDHETTTWQHPHPHASNPPASAHSQTPSQVHAQVSPAQSSSSFARSTPLVPTTVDPAANPSARTPSAFSAPPPKHRSTHPPPSPYTPNTSNSYTQSYPSSSSTSAPYTPYNTSPNYTANTTSPTFSPSQSYGPASANGAPPYPSHHAAYPTPTSAYPHPPPSPTPTPTQPAQPHAHAHSPSHYVPSSASATTYPFDDTRSGAAYESQGQAAPLRGHPQVQDSRDSRPITDRARYPSSQPKVADNRIDSRHEIYHNHPPTPASVPASTALDPRQYPSPHETRPPYSHQPDTTRPANSFPQAQASTHVHPQSQSEVARPYAPEQRAGAYTHDTKYTYPPQSHAPEPAARPGARYAPDSPARLGYASEAPPRPPPTQDSRATYSHPPESHGSGRGTGAPYVAEARQSSGYVSTQDTRHGYAPSETSAVQASYVAAEQRHAPPAPAPAQQFVSTNADQRSSFGDSRSAGAYPVGNNEHSRSGYTAPDSVAIPTIVPTQRPPPPPQPQSQHQLSRQNGQPPGYSSSLSSYQPQHAVPNYSGSPVSNSQPVSNTPSSHSHSQSQPYISPQQSTPHQSHVSQSSHGPQPPHAAHSSSQSVHSAHPAQAQSQVSHSHSHSQAQQHMHHPEAPRPAFVSPADTMHARGARFPMTTVPEDERERERDREREREQREREREREHEREREAQRERERESQREREKERERLAELREKEQRERERDRERETVVHEVLKHCTVLYNFATRYAQLQSSTALVQPPPEELAEMTHRAQEVVRLLESLRSPSSGKSANASAASSSSTLAPASAPHSSITSSAFGDRTNSHSALNAANASGGTPIDLDTRAPKRPWEETQSSSTLPHVSQLHLSNSPGTGPGGTQTAAERSAAEKDMEIIRTKRALTTSLAAAAAAAGGSGSVAGAVGGAVGAGKGKYRKRSRATPPGKCHSCNIRETPEWRRGPDGARTLCNACGLHYAKLVRKRDKALAAEGGSGTVMRIDMDMLRASARAAENEKAARAAAGGTNSAGGPGSSSNVNGEMDKMSVHTSSFQIVPMNMNVDSEPAQGQTQGAQAQAPPQTQTPVQSHAPPPQTQTQTSQTSTQLPQQPPLPLPGSGTPHLAAALHGQQAGHHGVPSAQGSAHYPHAHAHPQSQGPTRAHTLPAGPPPPPWAGKAYTPEMHHQHQQTHAQPQSFLRTSHSVSSGASPP